MQKRDGTDEGPWPPSSDASAELHPCDVVMKGGITSGVVYPSAVYAISRRFRLRNVGGASAGAIAAAAAAAAEYARHRNAPGFERLRELPEWLARERHLYDLFRPDPRTRPLFEVLSSFLGTASLPRKILRAALVAARRFWLATILAAIPAAAVLLWRAPPGPLEVAVAILLFVLAAPAAWAAAFLRRAASELPRNGYGLCSGTAEQAEAVAPLSLWLADLIDAIAAGRPVDTRAPPEQQPLTLGQLWCADLRSPTAEDFARRARNPSERAVNLEVVTTSLTHGRPYRVPFDTAIFFFDAAELRKVLPERVVGWMVQHAGPAGEIEALRPEEVHALPLPEHLPVAFLARASLSFPFLLSAVSLRAVDFTLEKNQRAKREGTPLEFERLWLSDGGISSNFPIHFFDRAIPDWPTFGLDLGKFHPDHAKSDDEAKNVWLPSANVQGIAETWHRFDGVPAFAGVVADAVQAWMDGMFSRTPGFRERIAHVFLDDEEGGLNLDMPRAVIRRLAVRGHHAGVLLRDAYAPDAAGPSAAMINHQWVRYRSAIALLDRYLLDLRAGIRGADAYRELIAGLLPPPSYQWRSDAQRDLARWMTRRLMAIAACSKRSRVDLAEGAPRPMPELRASPKV